MGTAMYRDERVMIIDAVWNPARRSYDYLVNYGGPVWVGEDELGSVVMVISA